MDEAARARLEDEALKALHACRASLLGSHGFIATLAMQLELVPVWDFRMPTAATDALRIYVRPDWILALSFEQRTFVLAHEVMHCAMLHFARTMTGDHRLWNIAWDHEVNDLLLADGMTPPESMVWFPERRGWSAEQVYNQLVEAEDDALAARGPHCDVHLGQPIDGVGRQSAGEPLEVDPRFTPELERTALEAWPHRVRGALNARGAGVGSAIEQRLINRTREAALPWRSMLAAFVTRAFGGSAQWLPPARRHVHRGVYLPSRRGETLKITVAVDTSGSTTLALPDFFAELAGIVAAFPRYELTLIACDDVVHSVEVFSEDRPLSVDAATLVGGGGTDLCPPFAWLAERAYDVDVMVYLTDGFGPAPAVAPPWPVLWVLVPHGRTPAPWADAVWMEAAPAHELAEGHNPPTYANLTRFHGVFAPTSRLRAKVVPRPPSTIDGAEPPAEPQVSPTSPPPSSPAASPKSTTSTSVPSPYRLDWAALLKRVFGVDILKCSRCLGQMRLIACIEEPDVAKKILEHLGLRAEPLPTLRAQAPPVTLELFHEA